MDDEHFGKLANCVAFNIGNRRHRNYFQKYFQNRHQVHLHIHSCYHIDCNMGYSMMNMMNRIYNIEIMIKKNHIQTHVSFSLNNTVIHTLIQNHCCRLDQAKHPRHHHKSQHMDSHCIHHSLLDIVDHPNQVLYIKFRSFFLNQK